VLTRSFAGGQLNLELDKIRTLIDRDHDHAPQSEQPRKVLLHPLSLLTLRVMTTQSLVRAADVSTLRPSPRCFSKGSKNAIIAPAETPTLIHGMIAAKVVGRIELLNGEVERLGREAVDRELDRLIGELVSERDGAGDRDASPAMRVCNGCGTAKLRSSAAAAPARRVGAGRIGPALKHDVRSRRRRQTPSPFRAPSRARDGSKRPGLFERELRRWLISSGFAEVRGGRLVATTDGFSTPCAVFGEG
jgi:hypothetical protein